MSSIWKYFVAKDIEITFPMEDMTIMSLKNFMISFQFGVIMVNHVFRNKGFFTISFVFFVESVPITETRTRNHCAYNSNTRQYSLIHFY